MKRKKCLHVIPLSKGGIRQHLLQVMDGLGEMPLGLLVAAPEDNYLVKELKKRAIKYIKLEWDGAPSLKKLWQLTGQLKKILAENNIDLVHAHGHKAAFASRFINLFAPKKTKQVLTIHNFSPGGLPGCFLKKANQYLDSYSTNKIITVSKSLLIAEVLPGNHNKATVIYNGIDLTRYRPVRGQKRMEVIGTIARLAQQKGITYLLKAFQKVLKSHPDLVLHIIGEGPEGTALQTEAQELGIAKQTLFKGNVSDVLPELEKIDLFIMPSLSEGLSIATIEAVAAGKPVIASRTGGLVEVIEDGVTGILVKPGCFLSLAEAINKLLSFPELRQAMADRGRKRAEEIFGLNQMLAKTRAVYEEMNM